MGDCDAESLSLVTLLSDCVRLSSLRWISRACNYHTRALRHVRTVLTDDLAQTVACSIVGSRLDYCNVILYGGPAATLDLLQRAQNNPARVVCQRRGRTDARPLLRSLHWLPVKHRVTYKMAALTFKTTSSSTPACLNDLIRQLFQFVLCGHPTPRCWRPKNAYWVRASVFFGRGSAHLELTTIRRQILPYCGHLQTTPQDPSFQTVLTWRHQRLCIFGLYGAIQMLLLLLLLGLLRVSQ